MTGPFEAGLFPDPEGPTLQLLQGTGVACAALPAACTCALAPGYRRAKDFRSSDPIHGETGREADV